VGQIDIDGGYDDEHVGGVLPGQLNSGSGDSSAAGGDDPETPLMKAGKQVAESPTHYDRHKKTDKADVDMHQVASATKAVQAALPAILMERGPLVISPRVWYMRYWDIVTMVLLFYTAVVTPVEVAFIPTKINILFWVNRGVDGCFLIDIFFNFFVAIPDPVDGQLVYHHPTIIRSYLRGWFVIDVVSILPFDLVSIVFENGAVSKLKILRAMRLLKLMKLLRILRAGRIFQRLETQFTIDYSALELVKFGILALTCSHWMACAWGLVADLEDATHNWLKYTSFNQYTEEGLLAEGQDPRGVVRPLEIYVAALYWSSMTMSTIGYGDIVPSTFLERIFVSIAMLVGAFVYGYIIGAVSNVISTRNAKTNRFHQLMSELNAFLDEGKFKPELRVRLREYFKYRLSGADVEAHTALLKQLSPALRAEITMSMNTWINKVDFFQQCPEAGRCRLNSVDPQLERRLVSNPYPWNTNPGFKMCLSNSTRATTSRRWSSSSR
jgi:voltage-gated potassium channel Kch